MILLRGKSVQAALSVGFPSVLQKQPLQSKHSTFKSFFCDPIDFFPQLKYTVEFLQFHLFLCPPDISSVCSLTLHVWVFLFSNRAKSGLEIDYSSRVI